MLTATHDSRKRDKALASAPHLLLPLEHFNLAREQEELLRKPFDTQTKQLNRLPKKKEDDILPLVFMLMQMAKKSPEPILPVCEYHHE